MKVKLCVQCKKLLSIDSFGYRRQRSKNKICVNRKSYCKKCISDNSKEWRNNNIKQANDYERNYYQVKKIELIKLMGGKCVCCGLTQWWVLTFDHIKPTKSKKRMKVSIFKLLKNEKLREKLQLMCSGCNSSKGFYNECKINHNI